MDSRRTYERAPKGTYKFEVNSQLVVVNVSAKDKNGAPLEGLTSADFTVSEDGKAQQIKVFEFQRLEETPMPAPEAAAAVSVEAKPGAATLQAAAKTIAPSKAGEVKYKDRRLLVMFFDQAGMPVADQIRAQRAALKFVKSQITASDLVAVMTYATSLNVVQDFTSDRDTLEKVIRGLTARDIGMANGSHGRRQRGRQWRGLHAGRLPSSTSSTRTGSWPLWNRRSRCWAACRRRRRWYTSPAA